MRPLNLSTRYKQRIALIVLPAMLALAGCSAAESAHPAAAPESHDAADSSGSARSSDVVAQGDAGSVRVDAAGNPQETWFAMYVEGSKVGYGRTATARVVEQGRNLSEVEEEVHFSVNRNGQRTEEQIVSTGVETPDGQLLRFETRIDSGPQPIVTKGTVRDGQMVFETTTTGKTTSSSIPWPAGVGGFKATENSLARQPMQPSEHRKLAGLMVGFNQVAQIELAAAAYEPTTLVNHSQDLLRIDWTATLPAGTAIRSVWWTDREGQVMKMQIDALHQDTYRTTREMAMAEGGPARFDLLLSTIVPVNRPLENAHRTKRVRYRVQLANDDPSRVFASGISQRVTPLDPHTAEIVVRAIRPGGPSAEFGPGDAAAASGGTAADMGRQRPPTDEDRQPNNLVQSDAPRIVALAKEAAGDKKDPWETSVALERFVHSYITAKNYSQAFSTAVEVADSREGACTQHAVLLAALARARGIPARVAIGLVYMEDNPGFAFHMWNEVWIGDRWIPLDATRGLGGIGAAHLKLVDSSLQGESAYSCFLPVTQVIGQAKIEILEAE